MFCEKGHRFTGLKITSILKEFSKFSTLGQVIISDQI